MNTVETWLSITEALVTIGGTYDTPAHDIQFEGISFTGGYIGENVTYPAFEASRPRWWQMPSAIQISAAYNIRFTGGTYTQLESGGFGIGNDPNAHLTGVGLGVRNITVTEGYFTQVMGNSIMAGGIQADGHHPSDPRMTNSQVIISDNIFYNVSSLFSSTVPIFVTYLQDSVIANNDLSTVPYSGICHGYGWGSNDAGGSQTYIDWGLYAFQPLYQTPTTSQNNNLYGNLIHGYGFSHTDLGGIYTLSKSPSTKIHHNDVYDSGWFGLYLDEGSNSVFATENNFLSAGSWYNPNQGCATCGYHTGNNTLINNFGRSGWPDMVGQPNQTGQFNNTFIRNYRVSGLGQLSPAALKVAYRAGVSPGKRAGRPVSNDPTLVDAFVSLDFSRNDGTFAVNLTNFHDVSLTSVSWSVSVTSPGHTLTPILVPTTIQGDSAGLATYRVQSPSCSLPSISAAVTYTNPRTGTTRTLETSGTMPGDRVIANLTAVSAWQPAQFGQKCDILGIRAAGRGMWTSTDDWSALYEPASIGASGNVTVKVLSLYPADPWTKAGVVMRNSLQVPASGALSTQAWYAAVVVTLGNGVSFQWDADGNGAAETWVVASGVMAPVFLRLAVNSKTFRAYYFKDCVSWTEVGSAVTLGSRGDTSDAGIVLPSHAWFTSSTALFSYNLNTKL